MEIKRNVLLLAFLITVFLLASIVLIGNLLNVQRKDYVEDRMTIIEDMNDLQSYAMMSDVYGSKIACLAFKSKLREWDNSLWDLGMKLEKYRVASEEFRKDPFYNEQKTVFNENQLLYLLFLTKVKKECSLNQTIITFFYQNSDDCKGCDDQSFVLSDIKNDARDSVSIFSFDKDLNITNVKLLMDYYEVEELPCIIINEQKFCGIQNKLFITKQICATQNLEICKFE